MPRFRSEPFQLLSSPLLLHFSAFSLPCPSVHTHWQQLQSQWDALHSWQRKNTAAGERKQIQIWHCPLPSCSVRAPVKTDLLVWFLNHCKLLFSVYLLRINPCLRTGKDFSFKGRGWGMCSISPREPVAVPAPVLLGSVLQTCAAGITAAAVSAGLWSH